MKIIEPSATLLEHNIHPYKFIERVGRVCYKSEDKITENSAVKMVSSLIKSRHLAILEHEHIYLEMSGPFMYAFLKDMDFYNERLTFFNITNERGIHVFSGSFRSFYELFEGCLVSNTLYYIRHLLRTKYPLVFGEPDPNYNTSSYTCGDCREMSREDFIFKYADTGNVLFKHLIHTFLFVCDRGVSHEFVRHRVAAFAQESTRFCNYSNDKFGNEITVIKPCFWDLENHIDSIKYGLWKESCLHSEKEYFALLNLGAQPQQARTVLPNSLKTELVITATEEEWQHIVDLRYIGTTGAPHPQMKEVMGLALPYLLEESCGKIVAVKGEQ